LSNDHAPKLNATNTPSRGFPPEGVPFRELKSGVVRWRCAFRRHDGAQVKRIAQLACDGLRAFIRADCRERNY
jgi:hypothetical protein